MVLLQRIKQHKTQKGHDLEIIKIRQKIVFTMRIVTLASVHIGCRGWGYE